MTYCAAARDIAFILNHLTSFPALYGAGPFGDLSGDLVASILSEAAKLSDTVLAASNRAGDLDPAHLVDGQVKTSRGFAEAYAALAEGGWIALAAPQEYGGMGLPNALGLAVNDMMAGANMALHLKLMLTQGQIEALHHHGSEAQKALYLPKLVSGTWSGTMNLTEPQAGSDLGDLRTRAMPCADGSYEITGQKIFISWGDSDLVENVCHLVLARLPDAPAGTKGISLFLVPKYLPAEQGASGEANRLHVAGLEHKMGLHGSPTCVMVFDAAKGWIVGGAGQGLAAMFAMMNNARLSVGVEGIGVAEAAVQKAAAFAAERVQGQPLIAFPDIRRLLAEARAELFAARALALKAGVALDMARLSESGALARETAGGEPVSPADWMARAAFLTPIVKAYGTETGMRAADAGIQVHGGMGYVEETGAAQFFRDVRVSAIYEGTNGIQALDLVGRKMRDEGQMAGLLLQEVQDLAARARPDHPDLAEPVWEAAEAVAEAVDWLVGQPPEMRAACAHDMLQALALVLGAGAHLEAVLADPARLALAAIHIGRVLPRHAAALAAMRAASGLRALSLSDLGL
ncbi:acyl-CoA dehydrogenase family protein [Thioclava litoralis]|uniref:Acyl-CoA dehydrogenase family protein n=1 Tax=Thioclava litoralis TaxID=3076557 RepID=A0ABZ1E3I1_9RHOB|nr:acyl-CoA dehydrogenase family protein [Thioclava sp. FTW29]